MVGISVLLALNFHKNGWLEYKTGFYWSLGNLAISIGAVVGNYGTLIGGWWAVPYFFVLSSVAYFAALGVLVAFKRPKNVKCWRCQYVEQPNETGDSLTPYDEAAWKAFRSLNAQIERGREK